MREGAESVLRYATSSRARGLKPTALFFLVNPQL